MRPRSRIKFVQVNNQPISGWGSAAGDRKGICRRTIFQLIRTTLPRGKYANSPPEQRGIEQERKTTQMKIDQEALVEEAIRPEWARIPGAAQRIGIRPSRFYELVREAMVRFAPLFSSHPEQPEEPGWCTCRRSSAISTRWQQSKSRRKRKTPMQY